MGTPICVNFVIQPIYRDVEAGKSKGEFFGKESRDAQIAPIGNCLGSPV